MRIVPIFVATGLLAASCLPVLAIDAKDAPKIYEDSNLTRKADVALWCGAYLSLAAQGAKTSSDKKLFQDKANVLLSRAGVQMVQDGLKPDEVGPIAEAYTYHAADQVRKGESEQDYTAQECLDESDN